MRNFAALCALAVLEAGCHGGSCPFNQQCDGSVLETCQPGSGIVGAQVTSQDCSAAFATCVEPDAGSAFCAANPCDPTTFINRCSGTVLFFCDTSSGSGFVQGVDCFNSAQDFNGPGSCFDPGSGANCVSP